MIGPVDVGPTPPHDIEVERAVLGSCLADPLALEKALAIGLCRDDLYDVSHRTLFEAMLSLRAKGSACDLLLLRRHLDAEHILDNLDTSRPRDRDAGLALLASIAACVASGSNVEHYARAVLELSGKRHLLRAGYQVQAGALNGQSVSDALSAAKEHLAAVEMVHAPREALTIFEDASEVNMTKRPANWLLRGYVAIGAVTLITALPKAGKSTWVFGFLGALERGDPEWIGCALLGPGSAVILSEEPRATIAEKVSRFGIARAKILARENAYPRRPLARDVDAAIAAARSMPDCKVVVVDTWRFWANLGGDQAKSSGYTQAAYAEIARIAAAGYAVIVVHHMRKSGGEEGTAAADSNALVGAVEVNLELYRFGKSEDVGAHTSLRRLVAYGRFDRIPEEAVVELTEAGYVARGSASSAKDSMRESRVLGVVLGLEKWATTDEVIDRAKMSKAYVLASLRVLHSGGKVQMKKPTERSATGQALPTLWAGPSVRLEA